MNSWGEAFGEKGTLRLLRQDSEEWVRWSEVFNVVSCRWSFPKRADSWVQPKSVDVNV